MYNIEIFCNINVFPQCLSSWCKNHRSKGHSSIAHDKYSLKKTIYGGKHIFTFIIIGCLQFLS